MQGNPNISMKIRVGAVKESALQVLGNVEMMKLFSDKIKMVNEGYVYSESIEEMRSITSLNSSRNKEYPDDIQTYLLKEGLSIEVVWLRSKQILDGSLWGILLNEPKQVFTALPFVSGTCIRAV